MADKGKKHVKAVKDVPRKKGKAGYDRPQQFAPGIILIDLLKNKWEVREKIGHGGFADVYTVQKLEGPDKHDADYAVKIEPKENGPLFTEIHFYLKFLKPDMLKKWQKDNGLSFLGLPEYYGSGSYDLDGVDHRFLVMNRFGDNITTKLYQKNKEISLKHLSKFLQQITDALHYMHSKEYVHGDIKTENLLLRYNSTADEVYLLDYGLASPSYKQEQIIPDKKKQHNGTLQFCSRDNHLGITTKRGDMESLGYAVLTWCNYKLPWTDDNKSDSVQEKKVHFMSNLSSELANETKIPKQIVDFLSHVCTLDHLQSPDYKYLKELFSSIGNTKIEINQKKGTPYSRKVPNKEVKLAKSNAEPNIMQKTGSKQIKDPLGRGKEPKAECVAINKRLTRSSTKK